MRPNARIAALIALTLTGLVGMFVTDGWQRELFLVTAFLPLAVGVCSSVLWKKKTVKDA